MSLMTAFVFLALGWLAIFGILRIHDKTLRSIDAQARRKPLTYEQIRQILDECDEGKESAEYILSFARAVERAHNIR